MTLFVIIIIGIALLYDFLNGMNDAANSIATVVSTRVLTPFQAVLWAAFFNYSAIWFFGTEVANTIGKIIRPDLVNEYIVLGGLLGAGTWVLVCTLFGLPISVSHSLIGGIIGPALIQYGVYDNGELVFHGEKLLKTCLFIFLAPIIGLVTGYLLIIITYWVCRKMNPRRVDVAFRALQLASSAAFSIGHGSNDAQKTMGIIMVLLFATGNIDHMGEVPEWVKVSCYLMISLGTMIGGWRVIKTMGMRLTHLKPVGGFSAETAGAFTLFGTAIAGIPASTTHTITGAIMGVGMSRRFSAVKWGVAGNIMAAWILTIPASCVMAMLCYLVVRMFS
ncbi:MAG: inorganic phosphate transporter [Bacteroidetes bacterium]|nr:MAG: inorganic phosphate transporter [Bacteroidota bacterium]REK00956.1 MAG: inorganic phosphate transporter [Bacteroidota bacterium]REK34559.1 MAG: inorganic phosphate transporter [Bacteroidota bacterium]REK51818.1 MAG: inorganic phosphate transporter [Bacteroidota bacterium]